jgi:hypothetical protein
VTRSSEARIIGNSHVPKDLPKEGRRKISRGQGEGGFDRDRKAVQCSRPNTIPNTIEPKRQSTKERADGAITLTEKRKFQNLERSFATLAENEEWLSTNHDKTVHGTAGPAKSASSLLPKRR